MCFDYKKISSLIAACALCLFIIPDTVYAQVLDEVSVKRLTGKAKVKIRFNSPVQVTSFFPAKTGKVLTISVRLVRLGSDSEPARRQRISSFNRLGGLLPLHDVTYEPRSDDSGRVLLRFSRTVNYKLQRGRDGRSIIVLVTIKQPVKRKTDGVNEDYPYALNLESRRSQITHAKPMPSRLRNLRLYVIRYSKSGTQRYRLRLGFFPTKNSAQQALARVRKRYPKAWVARVSRSERKASRKLVVLDRPPRKKSKAPPVGKRTSVEKQMRAGRKALLNGDNKTAIAIFKRIAHGRANKYRRDALELLGLAYERDGNLSRARTTYKLYLKKYPKGENATRVQQRIASLSRYKGRRPLKKAKRRRRPGALEYYGSWSQRLFTGVSSAAGASSVDQTVLVSNLYANARARTKNVRYRANLNADHTWDFLNASSTSGSVRTAYVEAKGKANKFEAKAGRQSGNERGVLGRYDGLSGGYNVYSDWSIYGLVGKPIDNIAPGSTRGFEGLSIDTRIPSKDLSLTIFGINNTIDGLVDRQAVGVEARYFNSKSSGFTLIDYDRYFNELNIFLVQGDWKKTKKRSYHFMADYRKSPALRLSNALFGPVNGTTYTSIADLRAAEPGIDIYQLARDRTANAGLLSAGITHNLSTLLQLSGDLSVSEVSGLPAVVGEPAIPGTGLLTTLAGRVTATNWLLKNSVSVAGVSISDASTYRAMSLYLTERASFKRVWRADVNLRLYLVDNDNGTNQTRLTPALRLEYRRDRTTFEFELGQETVDTTGTFANTTGRTFLVLGYRIDF
jgi:hypothetical protein